MWAAWLAAEKAAAPCSELRCRRGEKRRRVAGSERKRGRGGSRSSGVSKTPPMTADRQAGSQGQAGGERGRLLGWELEVGGEWSYT